jgi:hypothetical protein
MNLIESFLSTSLFVCPEPILAIAKLSSCFAVHRPDGNSETKRAVLLLLFAFFPFAFSHLRGRQSPRPAATRRLRRRCACWYWRLHLEPHIGHLRSTQPTNRQPTSQHITFNSSHTHHTKAQQHSTTNPTAFSATTLQTRSNAENQKPKQNRTEQNETE